MISQFFDSPLGRLILVEENGALTHLLFSFDPVPAGVKPDLPSPVLEEVKGQLGAYFAGRLKEFAVPLAPKGTDFQRKVWMALCKVPYGSTATYGEIARRTGNPKACRAVGLANNKNPIAIIIPCHRIVGSTGKLTG